MDWTVYWVHLNLDCPLACPSAWLSACLSVICPLPLRIILAPTLFKAHLLACFRDTNDSINTCGTMNFCYYKQNLEAVMSFYPNNTSMTMMMQTPLWYQPVTAKALGWDWLAGFPHSASAAHNIAFPSGIEVQTQSILHSGSLGHRWRCKITHQH